MKDSERAEKEPKVETKCLCLKDVFIRDQSDDEVVPPFIIPSPLSTKV